MGTLDENAKMALPRRPTDPAIAARSIGVHSQVTTVMAQDPKGIEQMRKRMSEVMAKKQQEIASKQSPQRSPSGSSSPTLLDPPTNVSDLPSDTSLESMSSVAATMSTDSAKTVRAPFDATPSSIRTPSYPFPRMNMRLQRGLSSRSGPHHRPFTLLSPTAEPPELHGFGAIDKSSQQTPSDTSTPMGKASEAQQYPGDSEHPTPDLYDMVLMLSTEPGLDAWWSNVTEILVEAYGAERASLARPGDITDLENVPWGQKASFNINASDSGDSTFSHSNIASEVDFASLDRESRTQANVGEPPGSARRPPLTTRVQ